MGNDVDLWEMAQILFDKLWEIKNVENDLKKMTHGLKMEYDLEKMAKIFGKWLRNMWQNKYLEKRLNYVGNGLRIWQMA